MATAAGRIIRGICRHPVTGALRQQGCKIVVRGLEIDCPQAAMVPNQNLEFELSLAGMSQLNDFEDEVSFGINAYDLAGNLGRSDEHSLFVDTARPRITNRLPDYSDGKRMLVSAAIADLGSIKASSVSFSLTNPGGQDITSPAKLTKPSSNVLEGAIRYQETSDLPAGTYRAAISAEDIAGNAQSLQWDILIDPAIPPEPTITIGGQQLDTIAGGAHTKVQNPTIVLVLCSCRDRKGRRLDVGSPDLSRSP